MQGGQHILKPKEAVVLCWIFFMPHAAAFLTVRDTALPSQHNVEMIKHRIDRTNSRVVQWLSCSSGILRKVHTDMS